MALYEITLTAVKTFYVNAASEKAALQHEVVNEEECFSGNLEWKFVEGEARKLGDSESKHINKVHQDLIFK